MLTDTFLTGNSLMAQQLRVDITPASVSAQALVTSNGDGTLLLTFSSSLAADFKLDLSYNGLTLASASVNVFPNAADAAGSQLLSTDFGFVDPGSALTVVAGRSYEFGVLLFDAFGNRARDSPASWVLEVSQTDGNGKATAVQTLNQRQKRWGTAILSGIVSLPTRRLHIHSLPHKTAQPVLNCRRSYGPHESMKNAFRPGNLMIAEALNNT